MTISHTLDALEEDVPLREDLSRLLAAAPPPALSPALRAGTSQVAGELARAWSGGTLPAGARVGPYTVEGTLGEGGQGVVYRARDAQGHEVALKVPRPELVSRLIREAQILFHLDHPRVVRIEKAAFKGEEIPYVATELLSESLADRLARRPEGLGFHLVLLLADHILDALDYAHGKGVVHRDLKPSNILFTRGHELKVADFGIGSLSLVEGRRVDGTLVSADRTVFAGTPAYMAPEQEHIERPLDGRADLYALGKVLYQALSGRSPRTVQPLSGRVEGVTPAWDAFMFRLLEDRPEDRFPSAQAAREALAALPRASEPPRPAPSPAPLPMPLLPPRADALLPTASARTLEALLQTVQALRQAGQGGVLALAALPARDQPPGPVATLPALLRGALAGAVVIERDRVVGTLQCPEGRSRATGLEELAVSLSAWGEAVVLLVRPGSGEVVLGCYGLLRPLPDVESLRVSLMALLPAGSAGPGQAAASRPRRPWAVPLAAAGGVLAGLLGHVFVGPALASVLLLTPLVACLVAGAVAASRVPLGQRRFDRPVVWAGLLLGALLGIPVGVSGLELLVRALGVRPSLPPWAFAAVGLAPLAGVLAFSCALALREATARAPKLP